MTGRWFGSAWKLLGILQNPPQGTGGGAEGMEQAGEWGWEGVGGGGRGEEWGGGGVCLAERRVCRLVDRDDDRV